MAGGSSKVVRILGIAFLCMVIALASLIFLLLAACGLFSAHSSEDQRFLLIVLMSFVAIVGGGFYGIFKLARGLSHSPPAVAEVTALPAPLSAEEAGKLLLPLRLAIGVSIGASFLGIVLNRMQPGYPDKLMPVLIVSFVLYQLPYAAVLWLTREQPERNGVALAFAFSAVSVLWSLWTWGTLLRYLRDNPLLPGQIGSLIDLVATGAAAYFAWQLWRRDKRAADEAATLVLWFIGSGVYLAVVQFVQTMAFGFFS